MILHHWFRIRLKDELARIEVRLTSHELMLSYLSCGLMINPFWIIQGRLRRWQGLRYYVISKHVQWSITLNLSHDLWRLSHILWATESRQLHRIITILDKVDRVALTDAWQASSKIVPEVPKFWIFLISHGSGLLFLVYCGIEYPHNLLVHYRWKVIRLAIL